MSEKTTSDLAAKAPAISRLFRYARRHRKRVLLAASYSVLNKVFDLAPPVLIGAAVDVVVAKQESFMAKLGASTVMAQLWWLAGITLVVWAAESIFEYLYAISWRRLAQTVQHELRVDAYRHLQTLDLAYFEDRSTGGLMAILNDDINQLERFLDDGANRILQLATTILAVSLLFWVIVPSVAWMAMVPMPVVIWGSMRFQRRLQPLYAAVRHRVGVLSARLANNLLGIVTIKSFVAEEAELAKVSEASRDYEYANRVAIRLSSAFVPLIRMAIVMGFCAILILGGEMTLAGTLNIGWYSVLVFMTQRLLWPLTGLGALLDQYRRAMASTERVLDVLDTRVEIADGGRELARQDVAGEIVFEDVGFSYAAATKHEVAVLEGFSLTLAAKSTVAFVGSTGAGKSTLVKLLLRFYEVTRGRISVDGVDIRDLKIADLRRAIALVSQDVFLFDGTVRDNIAYGAPAITEDEVKRAAKLAEAHEFITSLPKGYDTLVGERGQKLSGGQRQRIAIARAIVKDPPILILDEATSSVDNETEAAIQRSLAKLAVGRTTLVIAHRLSTVRNADQIFVLREGAVIEEGTHEDLVAGGGFYASLWQVQTGECAL